MAQPTTTSRNALECPVGQCGQPISKVHDHGFFFFSPKTLSDMKTSLLVALGTSFFGVYLSVGLATSPLPRLTGRPISHTHWHLATSSD
jgi:hypothetical protein